MSAAPAIAIDPYFRQQVAEIPAPDADGGIALVGAAALKLVNDKTAAGSCKSLPQYREVFPTSSRHVSVPSAERNKPEGIAMSLDKNPRTFRVRVKDALQRRVGKGKALTVKQLARAVGCSDGTIENLMSDGGTTEPSSRILRELMKIFDDAFANEVWGEDGFVIVRINTPKADAMRKVMEAHDELRRLG